MIGFIIGFVFGCWIGFVVGGVLLMEKEYRDD